MIEPVIIGDCTLYLGDCLDVLPTLAAGSVDAVVTDPPYGIRHVHDGCGRNGAHPTGRRNTTPVIGDDKHFDPLPLLKFRNVLMWGASHYASRLPDKGRWLAWDKLDGMKVRDSFSDVEFAWHSLKGSSRIFHYRWKGLACVKANESGGRRWHPTQKPVGLMKWCLEQAKVPPGGTVLDPFAGSFTTAVACIQTGRRFIGCELSPEYFAIGVKRIEKAYADLGLFQPEALCPAAPPSR